MRLVRLCIKAFLAGKSLDTVLVNLLDVRLNFLLDRNLDLILLALFYISLGVS